MDPVVKWIENLLATRVAHATLGGDHFKVQVTRGCPQGGVLSPLLWTLVIDDLLRLMERYRVYVQAYADDVVILVQGRQTGPVRDRIQQALQLVNRWCQSRGLTINPRKTEMVLFTKSRGFAWVNCELQGTHIPLSHTAKYLGVTFDQRLLWKDHLSRQVE